MLLYILPLVLSGIYSQASGSGNGIYENGPDGYGACSYPAGTFQYWAGAGSSTFQNSGICGACIEVKNTDNGKSVIVNVSDHCSGCGAGDLNINRNAFLQIGNPDLGRIPINWKQIRCPNVNGNLIYRWQSGSNEGQAGLIILNSAQTVSKVEIYVENNWKPASRNNNNVWIINGAKSPVNIRVTGSDGKVVLDPSIQVVGDGGNVPSNGQL